MPYAKRTIAAAILATLTAPAACTGGRPPSEPGDGGAGGDGGDGSGGAAQLTPALGFPGRPPGGCDGAPDDKCYPSKETCACSDCAVTAFCVPDQCVDDGECDLLDACICADCQLYDYCADPENCTDDGTCDSFYEGCHCADCADRPQCGP